MKVFLEPGELSHVSQLDDQTKTIGVPLPGLEERTGADMLISILDIPVSSDVLLGHHCKYGALVQLKRFEDLQASIVDGRLFHEINKMLKWTQMSWLTISGVIIPINGKAIIGKVGEKSLCGKVATVEISGRVSLDYNSVDAALDSWRLYGGYVKLIPENDYLYTWIQHMAKLLQSIKNGDVTELSPRIQMRNLVDPGPIAWLSALFDGIGHKTAKAVFSKLKEMYSRPATLYEAIAYVTTYKAVEIAGITHERIAGWRDMLGLHHIPESETQPALYESPYLISRLTDTGEWYWRGEQYPIPHYRNDGVIDQEKVFSVGALRPLVGLEQEVEDTDGNVFSGIISKIEIGPKFEYLIIGEDKIRIDKIVDVREV